MTAASERPGPSWKRSARRRRNPTCSFPLRLSGMIRQRAVTVNRMPGKGKDSSPMSVRTGKRRRPSFRRRDDADRPLRPDPRPGRRRISPNGVSRTVSHSGPPRLRTVAFRLDRPARYDAGRGIRHPASGHHRAGQYGGPRRIDNGPFTRALAERYRSWLVLPVPDLLFHLLMGEAAQLVLSG